MRKRLLFLMVVLGCMALVLSACSGGGGGGAAATSGSSTTSSSISGLVGGGTGGAGASSVSRAAGEQSVTDSPIPNAVVEILAFDKSGNQTDSASTSTLATGTFNEALDLADAGGYVVINVTKQGYTSYSKRIDFETPADLNLSAALNEVATTIIQVQSGILNVVSASGVPRRVVRIALFEDKATGKQTVVSGSAAMLRKQAGEDPILQLDIPADPLVGNGVSSLKADLKSYNPAIANDLSAFPGDFVDSSGNKLVSSGFNYIDITTDTGLGLGDIASGVGANRLSKAAEGDDPYIYITRQIPPGVCKNLLRDASCAEEDANGRCNRVEADAVTGEDGYDVPIYTYNSRKGEWVLLGFGTLDVNNDGIINGLDAGGDFDADGTVNIPGVDDLDTTGNSNGVLDHKDYQQYCKQKEDASEYLSLIIKVTNEDFISDWWNLDYPLLFEVPKQICTNVVFTDQNDNPLSGIYVSLYDDDLEQSYSYAWGSSDSAGKVSLKAALMDNADTDRTGTIGYWDPINYIYDSVTATLGETCTPTNIQIIKPVMCSVTGSVMDDVGSPMANQYVYVYSSTDYFYNWAYTDASGAFTMDAKCGAPQDVYSGMNWQAAGRFNPNGLINGTEASDADTADGVDGNYMVTLRAIETQNMPPYTYGWLGTTSAFAGNPVSAYIYGWDSECDSPLDWVIKDDGVGIANGTWADCWGYQEVSLDLATGNHPLVANVTDSKGKVGSYDLGTVSVVAAGNRPPVITYAYASLSTVGQGATIKVYGSAYDLDGNPITLSWDEAGAVRGGLKQVVGPFACTETGTNTASVSDVCDYTTQTADGNVTLTLTVSDGTDTVSRSFDIYVGSLPGELEIIIE